MAHNGDEDNHRSSSGDLAPSLRTLLNNSSRKSNNRRAIARRYNCLKWTGLFFSAICVIGGAVGFGTTLSALVGTSFLQQLYQSSSFGLYLLMITSVILILTGSVGLVAILRQNNHLLGTFVGLLTATIIFSLIGGSLTHITTVQADEMSLHRIDHIVAHDYGKDFNKMAILDIVQQSFKCCGSSGLYSWLSSEYSSSKRQNSSDEIDFIAVPKSCCTEPSSDMCETNHHHIALNSTTVDQFVYTTGCTTKLRASFSSFPYAFGLHGALWTGLTIATLQIAGIAVAIFFYWTVKTLRCFDDSLFYPPLHD